MLLSCRIYSEVEIVVPDELLEELASLRIAFAMFLREYEDVVQDHPWAREAFVKTLSRLYPKAIGSDHSFQSCFNTLIEKDVSLFKITYLNQLCRIFPHDVW